MDLNYLNFNLTIDEEISFYKSYAWLWNSEGRWAMYLIENILFPDPVIPFLPLFMGLMFHLAAMLLLIYTWDIKTQFQKIIVGSAGITLPVLMYLYSFSILCLGIGIGYFMSALALFLFCQGNKYKVYLAILPVTFTLAIYQPFIFVIISVFFIQLVNNGIQNRNDTYRNLFRLMIIIVSSVFLYFLILTFVSVWAKINVWWYLGQKFSPVGTSQNMNLLLSEFWKIVRNIYGGSSTIYSYQITTLGILMVVLLGVITFGIIRSSVGIVKKCILVLALSAMLLLPFVHGFLISGYYEIRHMVALPILLSGLIMLGFKIDWKTSQILIGVLSVICIFQFIRADNHLSGLSHIALQADRSLATRLIDRIEKAKFSLEVPESIKYIEMIGYPNMHIDEYITRYDNLGSSFFEWDQGKTVRATQFLSTLGFYGLEPLPEEYRQFFIKQAVTMPAWPAEGSIQIDGDVMLIKFGPYSIMQKHQICTTMDKYAVDLSLINTCVINEFK